MAPQACFALSVAPIPITFGPCSVTNDGKTLSFDITNSSDQALTAWAFVVRLRQADGQVLAWHQEDDAFLAADMPDEGMLGPRLKRRLVVGLPIQSTLPSIYVEPVAAIFEDTTSVGDASVIEAIFARRAQVRDELGRWREVYKAALLRHGGVPPIGASAQVATLPGTRAESLARTMNGSSHAAALAELDTALSAVSDPSGVNRSLQSRLRWAVHHDETSEAIRLERMALFARMLDIEYENAFKHTRRPKAER